jgi:hypothetical protein
VEAPSLQVRPVREAADPVEGNTRLTAAVAIVLLVLLAAEGATLLALHSLLRVHVYLGLVLVPPVLLKIGSTLYRFARYYTRHEGYRRKGPPHPLLRVLGPVLIVLTLTLLGSGVGLGVTHGNVQSQLLFAHKASFVLWFLAMTAHVLGHLIETARYGGRDWAPRTRATAPRGAALRRWSLAVSVVAGALFGAWGLTQLGPWVMHFNG